MVAFRQFSAGVVSAGTRFQAEMAAWTSHPRPLADWGGLSTDAWTAVGTIALAGVTLITLIVTIVISWHSGKQLRAERHETLAAEQLAEAYAVQVVGDVNTVVVNHGKYTITDIDAWLTLENGETVKFQSRTRVLGTHDLDAELLEGVPRELAGTKPSDHSDILAPWDAGLRFVVTARDIKDLADVYPVVQWTDRWRNRWEHRLGQVKKTEDQPAQKTR